MGALSSHTQTPQLLMHPGDKGTGDLSQSSPITGERHGGSFLKVLGHRGVYTQRVCKLTLQVLSEPHECQRRGLLQEEGPHRTANPAWAASTTEALCSNLVAPALRLTVSWMEGIGGCVAYRPWCPP